MSSDGGRVASSAVSLRPATPGPADEVSRRREEAAKSKPGTLRRFLDYREDIIDGFAIASFSNAKELESFVASQRSESVNRSESSALSVEPSDSPAPPTLDSDGVRHGVSQRRTPTMTTTSAPSSAACVGRKQWQPPKTQDAAAAATTMILHLPAHSDASSAPPTWPLTTLADDKTSACQPGALFAAAAAAAGALVMTRLSAAVGADLCPEGTPFADKDDDDSSVEDDGKTVLVPPLKKMLLLAGRSDAKTARCPSESARSLKTIASEDLADDDQLECRLRGQGSPAKWSANDDSSEPKKKKEEAEFEGRRKVHSEPRDPLIYTELSKIGSYLKTSTSLANCDIKEEEFHKKDVEIRCCSSSLTAIDISPNVTVDSKIPDLLLPHQPLDQKPSRSSSSRPATSSPRKPDCKAEGLGANQSSSPPSIVNPESGIFKKSGIGSSHLSLSLSSSSLQAKRSSCVVAHVSSSSSLPERGSVIVRECSGHQRSASNSTVKRECRSPMTPAHKTTVRQLSETRAPVNPGLSHSSTAVNPFPLFPLFDMEPSSIGASHPVYFPAAAHPAAYASNFSSSGLPFGLPPFQRSGMFAPSLGFPPSSNLMTSPLMGLSSHYHPEMMSLSSTPSPEMLTRLQQELNTRFLQDRGLLPVAPFTLHAEMHQHQHLHHHQHLLPGSYLPHPSFAPDALSLGKLPSGGGLLQSSQNLADFIDREQLTKASGLGAFSGLGCLSMVGGLAAPLPFGSGLSGAFQPKSGLSSLNLTPASQLLLSLRDRDPFLAAVNQLPQLAKKRGQWCSAHVQTAWKIYKMKCHLIESDKNLNNLKLHQTDSHSLVLPSSGNRLLLSGDRLRPSAILDSVFSPFGRQSNFSGYDSLDLPFARKIAYDATALSPNVLRPSDWNGLPSIPPPPPPLALQPSASLLVPGSWPKSGSNCSRSNVGLNVGSLERSNDYKERSLVASHKPDNRMTGKESHKSSSRPPSNANSISSEHRRTPSGLTHKGNGQFRSRSRSPLKFSAGRSSTALNGLTKDPRDDEEILCKPDFRMDNFPKIRSHDSGGASRAGPAAVECIGYSNPDKSAEPGHHRSDLFRLPRTRDPVSTGIPEHEQPTKESTIFADCLRHKNQPPFHATDFYPQDVYKASGGRLFSHHSPLPPGTLMPPLVGSTRSPPSPISAIKNSRVHNGWSISVSSSAGLIDIQSDSGLILR